MQPFSIKTSGTIIFILLLISSSLAAQTTYTCSYKQDCSWNGIIENYDNCIGGNEITIFEIDKEEKTITQTIQTTKTVYLILSKERKSRGTTIYMIKQLDGENYYYIVDSKAKEIRILVKKDGNASLSIYSQSNYSYSND